MISLPKPPLKWKLALVLPESHASILVIAPRYAHKQRIQINRTFN